MFTSQIDFLFQLAVNIQIFLIEELAFPKYVVKKMFEKWKKTPPLNQIAASTYEKRESGKII